MSKVLAYHLINEKLLEAEFFLREMQVPEARLDEVRYRFSAFCSAARSVLFVLRNVGRRFERFPAWDAEQVDPLWDDPLTRFFLDARSALQKDGQNPVVRAERPEMSKPPLYFFGTPQGADIPDLPLEDTVSLCERYLGAICCVVNQFYGDLEAEISEDRVELELFQDALREHRSRAVATGQWLGAFSEDSIPPEVEKAVLAPPRDRVQGVLDRYMPLFKGNTTMGG